MDLFSATSIGAIATVVGAVVGSVSAVLFEYYRQHQQEEQENEGARLLIQNERDDNQIALIDYWARVAAALREPNSRDEVTHSEFASTITKVPFPNLDWVAWESSLDKVPRFLGESDIRDYLRFRRATHRLSDTYVRMVEIQQAKAERSSPQSKTFIDQGPMFRRSFSGMFELIKSSETLVEEFKDTIESLDGVEPIRGYGI